MQILTECPIEQQNTALREITAIESHKVRRPVAAIVGFAQLFNNGSGRPRK